MKDLKIDVDRLIDECESDADEQPKSISKSLQFKLEFWSQHGSELFPSIVALTAREDMTKFNVRCQIAHNVREVDQKNGKKLEERGFTWAEISTCAVREANRKLEKRGFKIVGYELKEVFITDETSKSEEPPDSRAGAESPVQSDTEQGAYGVGDAYNGRGV